MENNKNTENKMPVGNKGKTIPEHIQKALNSHMKQIKTRYPTLRVAAFFRQAGAWEKR